LFFVSDAFKGFSGVVSGLDAMVASVCVGTDSKGDERAQAPDRVGINSACATAPHPRVSASCEVSV